MAHSRQEQRRVVPRRRRTGKGSVEQLGGAAEANGADLSVGRRIWYSLIGGAVYRRLGAEASGAYVAFLVIAVTTAAIVAVAVALSTARGLSAVAAAWPNLPDFSVTGGKLVVPPGDHLPVEVVAGTTVVILDASADPAANPLGRAPFGLLITGSEMLLRTGASAGGDRIIPLSALSAVPLTKDSLGELLRRLATVGVWLGAGFTVLYAVVRDLVRAAVIGWVGLIAVRFLGKDPGWSQAWRVGLSAWTLPMLAEASRVAVPIPDWSLWVVACVYAVYGCSFLTAP